MMASHRDPEISMIIPPKRKKKLGDVTQNIEIQAPSLAEQSDEDTFSFKRRADSNNIDTVEYETDAMQCIVCQRW